MLLDVNRAATGEEVAIVNRERAGSHSVTPLQPVASYYLWPLLYVCEKKKQVCTS
jgi:hypothetical protein